MPDALVTQLGGSFGSWKLSVASRQALTGPPHQMYQYYQMRSRTILSSTTPSCRISTNMSIPSGPFLSLNLLLWSLQYHPKPFTSYPTEKFRKKSTLQSKFKEFALEVPPNRQFSQPKRNPETSSPNPPRDQPWWLVRDLPQVPWQTV